MLALLSSLVTNMVKVSVTAMPPSSVSREEGVSELKSFKNEKGEMSVGKIIGVLIFVVIALALLPTVVSSVNAGTNATTGTAKALVPLITVFYTIGVLVGAIMWVVHETKSMG